MAKVSNISIFEGYVDITSFDIFCYFKLIVGYFVAVNHSVVHIFDMFSLLHYICLNILTFLVIPGECIALLQGGFGVILIIYGIIIAQIGSVLDVSDLPAKGIVDHGLVSSF